MSSDMSGPLIYMHDGTTSNAQVANTCLPTGERPNNTPIFISDVSDGRSSCLGSWQSDHPNKGREVDGSLSTAEGFRATGSTLRYLDGKEGVSFHNFNLTKDRCARVMVKNLGRVMPESVVREELEPVNIRVQGVTQLRSDRRDPNPAKVRPPTPNFIVSVARGTEVTKAPSLAELCSLRMSMESYVTPKGPLQCSHAA
jgi:hypothetical protein